MNKFTLFLVSVGLMSGAVAGCGGAANAENPDEDKQVSSNLDQTANPSENQISETSKDTDLPIAITEKPKTEEPKDLKSEKTEKKSPSLPSKSSFKQEPGSGGRVGRQEGQDRPRFGQSRMFRRGGGWIGILSRPDVRKELKLTLEQITKIEALTEQFRGQPGQRNPEGERDPNAIRERAQKMETAIKEILTTEQFNRLQELRLQLEGPSAIARPEVQEKLGLNDAQKKQIEDILNKLREEMRSMFQQGGFGSREEAMEAFRKMREENDKKLLAVLTEEQRKKWETMLGKPFKFESPPPRNRKK